MRDDPGKHLGLSGAVIDGRYRVDHFLGAGGMGAVYRATQLAVQRPVAIKLLQSVDVSDVQQQRFEREARIMATFTHPNIVQFYDLGRTNDGLTYIVMEYVDGQPLTALLKKGRFSVDFAVEVATQLFSALAEAHAHGVVHRDIKPENMLLAVGTQGDLRLKVLDFGLAYGTEDIRLTQAGHVSGTPYYIAPEVARGGQATASSDFYSAGIVMYEMLTGHPPFTGASMQVMFKHVNDAPPGLDGFVQQGLMPPELADLVMALLEKTPEVRPRTADAVLAVLAKFRVARKIQHADLSVELMPALSITQSRGTIPLNRAREGAVPERTTTVEPAASEVVHKVQDPAQGGWAAFHAAADAVPEPMPVLDPNLDGSFEFDRSIGASDVFLKPVAQHSADSLDQLSAIQIPAGAKVIATEQLRAVSPADAPSSSSAFDKVVHEPPPPSIKKAKAADLKPIMPAAATAQVHDRTPRRQSSGGSTGVLIVLLMILAAAVFGLYTRFSNLVRPTPTEVDPAQEAEWLEQKRRAEERAAAVENGDAPADEAPAAQTKPPPKKKKKPRAKASDKDVIELFDDQDSMKANDKITIERKK